MQQATLVILMIITITEGLSMCYDELGMCSTSLVSPKQSVLRILVWQQAIMHTIRSCCGMYVRTPSCVSHSEIPMPFLPTLEHSSMKRAHACMSQSPHFLPACPPRIKTWTSRNALCEATNACLARGKRADQKCLTQWWTMDKMAACTCSRH